MKEHCFVPSAHLFAFFAMILNGYDGLWKTNVVWYQWKIPTSLKGKESIIYFCKLKLMVMCVGSKNTRRISKTYFD